MGKNSENYFQRAQEIIPGGVNSPVRAFRGVGGSPLFIEQAQGSRIFDADNVQYIDCVGSWGPMILGHGHRYVVEAVKKAATRGFSFGAPTAGEIELAAIIVEPVAGNMGCVPPNDGFLQGLRQICDKHGALLILDEVMTGFRVAYGGAQALYGIKPDITTLGKIIGGGMPIGAYGASRKL